jgi:hypothetical protein
MGGLCLYVNPLCSTYDINGHCTGCYSGYLLSGITCEPVIFINPYCSSFIGTFCVNCFIGYYLNTGMCVPANPLCLKYYMNNGSCQFCYPGYYLSNGLCLIVNPLCQTYNVNGSCIGCFSGYFISGISCQSLSTLIPFCLLYNINFLNTTCTGCNSGYLLSNNTCIVMIVYCNQFNISGNCINCSLGY